MEFGLIYGGAAEVADILMLHNLGYEFVIEDGQITEVIHD